jgi:hypothetical protein
MSPTWAKKGSKRWRYYEVEALVTDHRSRQERRPEKQPREDAIRDIRRATRRHFSAEKKIRIVLEGLRGRRDSRALPPQGHRLIDVLRLRRREPQDAIEHGEAPQPQTKDGASPDQGGHSARTAAPRDGS